MRVGIFCIFFSFSLLFGATTKDKINKSTKSLQSTTKEEKSIHRKLQIVAKSIIEGEKSLQESDKRIILLQEQIRDLQNDSKITSKKLNRLTKENAKLVKSKKELEEKIINIIAEKFSFYILTDKNYQESTESIIGDEVLEKMDTILKKDFQDLNRAYEKTNATISEHNNEIKEIKASLEGLKQKQSSLKKLKQKRAKKVSNLKRQKDVYRKKLDKIVAQRNELKKTLQSLKILKKQEDKKRAEAKNKKSDNYKKGTINSKLSVKQIGSSYQQSKVKKYRGSKTIAPLISFSIKQKFGNYIDPIYKIKIFNESVVLQSKNQNAKVRNVLSGKVIFAKDTAMLDKVIIVENRLGIHTIYAHLNKIAPTIKVGKKIKKGYIIGRVDRDLTFEVTQKNYHINPLQLIKY